MNTKLLIGWTVAFAAVNWGLYGLMGIDLVKVVFGQLGVLATVVYVLIGVAGLVKIYNLTINKK